MNIKKKYFFYLNHSLNKIIALFVLFIIFSAMILSAALFSFISDKIKLINKSPSFLVCDKNNLHLFIYSKNDNEQGYWKVKGNVPERLKKTILAAEDSRFFNHSGVDAGALFRALYSNIKSASIVSGASTIPMQIARMQSSSSRNYFNKLIEAVTAIRLILKFGHLNILNQYLTISPFGPRIYGVKFASKIYFNKPIEDLTLSESALLAAIPKSPAKYNLYSSKGLVKTVSRAKIILKKLFNNKEITADDYNVAVSDLNNFIRPPALTRNIIMIHPILEMKKYLDKNYDTILKNIESSSSPKYSINSSLDFDLQKEIDYTVKTEIEKFRNAGAENCSLIIADKNTGGIKVYVGSADYYDEFYSGAINYNLIPHSPGSSLKPFIYAAGMIEKNYSGASILNDIGLILTLKNGIYAPQNYNRNFLGPITYRAALGNSRNIPAIEIVNSVGLDKIGCYLLKFGIIDNVEQVKTSGLSLAVGGLYTTLEKLLNGYGILANDGKKFSASFFEMYESKEEFQIIDKNTARQITLFLSDPLARIPTFERLGNLEYNFPVAVKTGTSNGYRDALVCAYTDKFIISIWLGTKNNSQMNKLTGENSAAELLNKIMPVLHKKDLYSLNNKSFPEPENYIKRNICLLSGKLKSPDCQSSVCEWFNKKNIPESSCDIHKKIIIDLRTGMPADKDCPEQFKQIKIYTVFPEKFADWAKSSGFALYPLEYKIQNHPNENQNFQTSNSKNNIIINEPANQTKIFIDQDTPEEFRTIALKTTVEPASSEVIWYIDNKPFKLVSYPYSARWKLSKGSHSVYVKIPQAGITSKTHYFFVD
ncbi:transglycosylase domain-containing protein [Candidatus Dependentiae bacterium]|nr:transglycosylase domain-containing protein [Candidatus Dependentiae bacterium]